MKTCPDCEAENPDAAVTCSECGSLFAEMIGSSPEPTFSAAEAPAPRTRVCSSCGAKSTGERCPLCGSRALLDGTTGATPGRARGHASRTWRSRPRNAQFDHDFPDVPHYTLMALATVAVLKAFVEVPLGASLVSGEISYGGTSATTLAWRFALGPVLFLAALAGGGGAYATYYVKRFGVVLLGLSFALDALLFTWLLVFMALGSLDVFPGYGPYVFFLLACVTCATMLFRIARNSNFT